MIYTKHYASPLGDIVLAESQNRLSGLWLDGQKYYLASIRNKERQEIDTPLLLQVCEWLDCYFAGGMPAVSELPLAPSGTDFQRTVWDILCEIPYGETTTYGDIARQIAAMRGVSRMSAQAVGSAVAHNPVSIIIPCHRVLGADGSLTGYAGGLDKKRWLLAHEQARRAPLS